MDWLSSFDPAAPRSSTRAASSSSTSTSGTSLHRSTSGSAAVPSGSRPSIAPSRISQTGRTTQTCQSVPVAGPSIPAYQPRPPRPPHRNRAAPPPAVLRSEDAQPNENDTRTKPWEIAAPPSIGASKSRPTARPHRPPSQSRPPQQRRSQAPYPPQPQPQSRQSYHPTHVGPSAVSQTPKGHHSEQRKKIPELLHPPKQPRPTQPLPSQPPSKKPRLQSDPVQSTQSSTKQTSTVPSNKEQKRLRQVAIGDVYPEIRLWTRTSKETAERLIANVNLSDTPTTAIQWLRDKLAPVRAQETQKAREYAAIRLRDPANHSDAVCLALRNCPELLLTLLKIRVEVYHCVAIKLLPHIKEDKRKFAARVVRHGRDVFLKLLRRKVTSSESGQFCATEQMLRPTDPILIEGLNQLHDADDAGRYALMVLENFLKAFGPRVLDITWARVHQWKRDNAFDQATIQSESNATAEALPDAVSSLPLQASKSQAIPQEQAQQARQQHQMDGRARSKDGHDRERVSGASSNVQSHSKPIGFDDVCTPPPSPPRTSHPRDQKQAIGLASQPKGSKNEFTRSPSSDQASALPRAAPPKLAQLNAILSIVKKVPDPMQSKGSAVEMSADETRASERLQSRDRISQETREAEELARYLEQLEDDEDDDDESMESESIALIAPRMQNTDRSDDTIHIGSKAVKTEADDGQGNRSMAGSEPGDIARQDEHHDARDASEDDHDEDRPLAQVTRDTGRRNHNSLLQTRAQQLDGADSDPDEDVPLQDLLQRQSSAGPSAESTKSRSDACSSWPSRPFQPKILGLNQAGAFSGARGLAIKYFVPVASAALEAQTLVRSRATTFDTAIAVSEHGRIATFSEQQTRSQDEPAHGLPSKLMRFQNRDTDGKTKGEKGCSPIDRVEDVSRLTSRVCGIVSSTKKLLGLGNHDEYPCQVSLVTVDGTGRTHRTYHLDERPHAQGAVSISHFPRTDPNNASSIDFATGGIDGIVNHWHWKAKSTTAETFRLHTLHDAKPVVALEHLSSRSKILASASIGTVVGFDLAALTLGFSWNTSDHIVHLQRTPDPKLMLGVLARRDYDQFRMFDITGRNGPISRPVISFGWLNDSEGKLPLGRGTFHPTRRAIFAHGAEDGHVRVWDMRNARDPLIDHRLGDEPIVETIWASPKGSDKDDILYVATGRGVRSISLLAP